MKKYIVSILVASVFLMGAPFVVPKAMASDMSMRDFINLLIIIGVISPDKIPAVNAYLATLGNTTPIIPPITHTTPVNTTTVSNDNNVGYTGVSSGGYSQPSVSSITVFNPRQGDVWYQGNSYTVSWSSINGDFDAYQPMLSNYLVPGTMGGGPTYTSVSKTTTSVSFDPRDLSDNLIQSWLANARYSGLNVSESNLRKNFYYTIQAEKNTDNGKSKIVASGISGTFSILPSIPTPQSSITVSYPNGGESLSLGVKDVDFRTEWTSQNLTGNVDVYLKSPSGSTCLIRQNVPVSQGYLTATLGTNYQCPSMTTTLPAGQYKVLLDIPNTKYSDESDDYFTITLATSNQPTLTVLSPNGGENFGLSSTTIPVVWTTNYNSDSVRVHLYSPTIGDAYVSPLVSSTVGKNGWTIPMNATDSAGQYKVNVCDDNQSPVGLSGKSLCDLSDSYFTISN